MKNYIWGLMFLGLMPIGEIAKGAVENTDAKEVAAVAPVSLPSGVITTPNPLKQAMLAKHDQAEAYVYRPSDNMPDLVHEDLLRGEVEDGKIPKNVSQFVGYVPKLKVLPCAKGCEGAAYEKAVKKFIEGYTSKGNYIKFRGELPVQVRWYNTRPWYQRSLPYGEDYFAVSLVMEGKLVTVGQSSGIGSSRTSDEIARDLGAFLGVQMIGTIGLGQKPFYLRKPEKMSSLKAAAVSVVHAIGDSLAGLDAAMGGVNVASRVEPFTDEYKAILPAFDGIEPGEINPIKEVRFFSPW